MIDSKKREEAQKIYNEATRSGADIARLSAEIAETGVPNYICDFAREIEGADINVLSRGIAKTKNTTYIVEFLEDLDISMTDELDFDALNNAMLETQDGINIAQYVETVENILFCELDEEIMDKFSRVVAQNATPDVMYNFAKNASHANKDVLYEGILRTGNQIWIDKFEHDLSQSLNDLQAPSMPQIELQNQNDLQAPSVPQIVSPDNSKTF